MVGYFPDQEAVSNAEPNPRNSQIRIKEPITMKWLLYGPALSAAIHDLTVNGDFRSEGLTRLNRQLTWCLLAALVLPGAMYLTLAFSETHPERALEGASFALGLAVLALIGVRRNTTKKEILPSSFGSFAPGEISAASFSSIPLRVKGWVIEYQFETEDGRSWKGKALNISDSYMEGLVPVVGQEIQVLFDQSHPRWNTPFISGLFRETCISKKKFEHVTHQMHQENEIEGADNHDRRGSVLS